MKNLFLNMIVIYLSASYLAFADDHILSRLNTEDLKDRKPDLKPCGLKLSTAERILDCDTEKKSKNGAVWKLVTRTQEGKEVWRDETTKLLWGDTLPAFKTYSEALNSCKPDLAENGKNISDKQWSLPSREDFVTAKKNGIKEILPNNNFMDLWSSSEHTDTLRYTSSGEKIISRAWIYSYPNDVVTFDAVVNGSGVRCVARDIPAESTK